MLEDFVAYGTALRLEEVRCLLVVRGFTHISQSDSLWLRGDIVDIASGRLFFSHRTFVLFNEERVLSDFLCHVKVYLLMLSLIITVIDIIFVAVLCWTELYTAERDYLLRAHTWRRIFLLLLIQSR